MNSCQNGLPRLKTSHLLQQFHLVFATSEAVVDRISGRHRESKFAEYRIRDIHKCNIYNQNLKNELESNFSRVSKKSQSHPPRPETALLTS